VTIVDIAQLFEAGCLQPIGFVNDDELRQLP
jgi:hypothetical protein